MAIKGKPKGLLVSDLVTPTGFSRVTHSIVKFLKDRYDFTGLGVNYRGDPHNYDFPIYPAMGGIGHIYGFDRLIGLINSNEFDFIYMLNDPWIIDGYLQELEKYDLKNVPPIVTYFPVDAEEHDKGWFGLFPKYVKKVITYTQFGKGVVNTTIPDLNVEVIPHGVDREIFYRMYDNRVIAKKYLFGPQTLKNLGDADELFIVLNANRNQPRKRLDITMEGFSKFAKDKPDYVKLYMHCGIRDASMDIPKLGVRLDIDDRIIVTNTNTGVQTVTVEELNAIYNGCDVGINTSTGEGWGLTNIEHAITGAPQIVPAHSACKELFEDVGELIPVSFPYTADKFMTRGMLVSSDDVANALQNVYDDKKHFKWMQDASIEKFSRPEYQWSTIAEQFDEMFKSVI